MPDVDPSYHVSQDLITHPPSPSPAPNPSLPFVRTHNSQRQEGDVMLDTEEPENTNLAVCKWNQHNPQLSAARRERHVGHRRTRKHKSRSMQMISSSSNLHLSKQVIFHCFHQRVMYCRCHKRHEIIANFH